MTEEELDQEGLDPQEAMLERLIHKALESNRVVIDFDVNPEKVGDAFVGFMTDAFAKIAEGIGNPLEAAGSGLADWFNDVIGGVIP